VKTRREDVAEIPVRFEGLFRLGARLFSKINVAVYKMSGGRLMNKGPANKPICLVTMRGRKTGKKREIPLMHVPDGQRKILVASLGGISKNPVWYHNLKADPDVTITVCARGEHRRPLGRRAQAPTTDFRYQTIYKNCRLQPEQKYSGSSGWAMWPSIQ
jgi:deazaflavin-dependent oxidoreductase (nitroreductase family)